MNKTQAKKALETAQKRYASAKRGKAAKAKAKAAQALRKAQGVYGAASRKGPRRTQAEIAQPREIEIHGVKIQVIETASSFYAIGDYPAHLEAAIEEMLIAMLDGDFSQDVHTFDKQANLDVETYNAQCAFSSLESLKDDSAA